MALQSIWEEILVDFESIFEEERVFVKEDLKNFHNTQSQSNC